ncbi:hypothetical protein OH687_03155 [Burkholderia anthina]|nr:hypothetical protein OH687_03155 [Burkholderia anthina]
MITGSRCALRFLPPRRHIERAAGREIDEAAPCTQKRPLAG